MAAMMGMGTASATPSDFSFTGTFSSDDNVQLFNFTAGGSSNIVLRTWSYAGGTNAAGNNIARGGFDPILALFDGSGAFINQNDDGGCSLVAADAMTGECWDTYFGATLAAGNYTVAIMEFDNFANGPNLSDGFARSGQGNFTAGWNNCSASIFCDVSNHPPGNARDSHWAFDILNVEGATQVPPNSVPEPSSLGMLGLGALLCGLLAWRRRRRLTA
ncbi:DVUA0089 family protein [Rhodanobacter lindaniclasticus]